MKAKHLIAMARGVVERHGGVVPDTMEGLVDLPGVARKTANVVLGSVFGKNEGVVVDTHVARLAPRLGLTGETEPTKIEQDLMRVVPRDQWSSFAQRLIWHGRRVCHAKKPDCEHCLLAPHCPSAGLGLPAVARGSGARIAKRPPARRAGGEQSTAKQPSAGRAGGEQLSAKQPSAGRAGGEQPAAKQPSAGQLGAKQRAHTTQGAAKQGAAKQGAAKQGAAKSLAAAGALQARTAKSRKESRA